MSAFIFLHCRKSFFSYILIVLSFCSAIVAFGNTLHWQSISPLVQEDSIIQRKGGAQLQEESISYSFNNGTFYGGPNNAGRIWNISKDSKGNIYATGSCSEFMTPDGTPSMLGTSTGGALILKLDSTLKKVKSVSSIGKEGYKISVLPSGRICMTGDISIFHKFPFKHPDDITRLEKVQFAHFICVLDTANLNILFARIIGAKDKGINDIYCCEVGEDIIVAINTSDYTLPLKGNQISPPTMFDDNIYAIAYDNMGNTKWATYLGGKKGDFVRGIVYDNSSHTILIAGHTSSTDFLGVWLDISPKGSDIFLAKFDISSQGLTLRKLKNIGGSDNDELAKIDIDTVRKRYIALLNTVSPDFPSPTAHSKACDSGVVMVYISEALDIIRSATIAKAPLALAVTSLMRAYNHILITDFTMSSEGDVYITGYTDIPFLTITDKSYSAKKQSTDGFLFILDSTLHRMKYCTYFGGNKEEGLPIGCGTDMLSIKLFQNDCENRVIIGLSTHSQDFPTTDSAFQPIRLSKTTYLQPAFIAFASPASYVPHISASSVCIGDIIYCQWLNPIDVRPQDLLWDFGDSSTSRSILPFHHYKKPGRYTIRLTIQGCNGNILTGSTTVDIHPVPELHVQDSILTVCRRSPFVVLKATGATHYRWSPTLGLWDPDKAETYAQPLQSTTYYVTGISAQGCIVKDSIRVNVNRDSLLVSADTALCKGEKLRLWAQGYAKVLWSPAAFVDDSTSLHPIAFPDTTTRFMVIATSGECSDTGYVTVRVSPQPLLQLSASSSSLCSGESVQLRASTQGGTLRWKKADGTIIGSDSIITQSPSETTTYYAILSTSAECDKRDSLTIIVSHAIMFSAQDVQQCSGKPTLCTVRNNNYDDITWSDLSGAVMGKGENYTTPPLNTPQKLVIHVRRGLCEGSDTILVTPLPLPHVQVSDATLCANQTTELRTTAPDPTAVYEWFSLAGSSLAQGIAYMPPPLQQTTSFRIRVTGSNGCSSEDTANIFILPQTHILLSLSDSISAYPNQAVEIIVYAQADRDTLIRNISYTIQTQAQAVGIEEALIDGNELRISQQRDIHLSPQRQEIARIIGKALVTQHSNNRIDFVHASTPADSHCVNITTKGGVLHIEPICVNPYYVITYAPLSLQVYPNPSGGEVLIHSESDIEEVQLFSLLGQRITPANASDTPATHKKEIRLLIEESGMYELRIRIAGRWMMQKVMIVH